MCILDGIPNANDTLRNHEQKTKKNEKKNTKYETHPIHWHCVQCLDQLFYFLLFFGHIFRFWGVFN